MGLDITTSRNDTSLHRQGFSLTPVQAGLLFLLLGLGVLWLGAFVSVALANTLLIFACVTGVGLWLCHRTRVVLGDPKLKILGTFWLVKVSITIFLLYAGWIPYLDPSSSLWGYDPQRYFHDAWEMIESGWNPTQSTNYQGIIFYYAGIFYLFGHNPVIPALINAFVTLLGTLFLIRCVYSFVPDRTPKDWMLAWLLLVPEVLWYDVMTSRETLMAALIIFSTFSVGRYLVSVKQANLTSTLLLSGTALLAVIAIRTSVAIPIVASIAVMAFVLRSRRKMGPLVKVLLVVLGIAALSAGPLIQQITGGYGIDFLAVLYQLQSFESNVAVEMEWSEHSLGLLLAPNNLWQALLYLPPRMVLYLAAPLPNLGVSLAELIDGNWFAWQRLMTLPTSVLMLLGFPYVLAGTAQAWRLRRCQPAPLVLHITFWITFMAVAGGNIIIHERYRLMFTLLLFACMWFGYSRCSHRAVRGWVFSWFGLLAAGAVFSMGYKLMG